MCMLSCDARTLSRHCAYACVTGWSDLNVASDCTAATFPELGPMTATHRTVSAGGALLLTLSFSE